MIKAMKEREMNSLRGQRAYYPSVDDIKISQEMEDDDQYKLSDKERWGITDDMEAAYQVIQIESLVNKRRGRVRKKGKWEL